MSGMDPETIRVAVDISGLAITLAGFVFVIMQIRRPGQPNHTTAHAAIYFQTANFRTHLMACLELRTFFFEAADIETGHPNDERATSLSEPFLNHLEHLPVQKSHFAGTVGTAWIKFAGRSLERRPVSRRRRQENKAAN